MNNSKKIILYIEIIVALCLLTASVFLYMLNAKNEAKIRGSLSMIDIQKNKVADLERLHVFERDISYAKKIIDAEFMNKEDTISFMEFVESLGRKIGVAIKINSADIEVSKKKEAPFDSFRVRLEILGSKSQALLFLSKLENMPYVVNVGKADFIAVEDSATVVRGNIEFSVSQNNK